MARIVSPETRAKMSAAAKARWAALGPAERRHSLGWDRPERHAGRRAELRILEDGQILVYTLARVESLTDFAG